MVGAHRGIGALVVLWLVVCASGLGLLWRYKARPGDPGEPPARWPAATTLSLASERPTLVMSVHPQCACTRASLAELERVMQGAPRDVVAHLLFVIPEGAGAGFERGALWDRVHRVPGAHVVVDHGGALAAGVFGLKVSGHVLVYDAGGMLRFSGGITGARGHEGRNAGEVRVASLLAGGTPDDDRSHVFGCSLEGEAPP